MAFQMSGSKNKQKLEQKIPNSIPGYLQFRDSGYVGCVGTTQGPHLCAAQHSWLCNAFGLKSSPAGMPMVPEICSR